MNKLILLLSFLFVFSLWSMAQNKEIDVKLNLPNYLKCGGCYYTSNYSGLSMLMSDLQTADVDTYVKLLPVFNSFEQKRNTALYVGGTGLLVGTSLSITL